MRKKVLSIITTLLLTAAPLSAAEPFEEPLIPTEEVITQPAAAVEEPVSEVLDEKGTADPLPIKELRLFVNILEQLKQSYVEPVDDAQLIQNAIKGMLNELDPHSTFYTKEEYESVQQLTTGSFAGLGVEVTADNGLIRVIAPIDDTPAERAGIKAGDLIIKIDETPVQAVDINRAIEMLRGDVGTDVTLTLIRNADNSPITVTITRDKIKTKSVKHELLNEQFGYIRLSQFQEKSSQEVQEALNELADEAKGAGEVLQGLILDLRNNPGGLLDEGVNISDLFLNSGLIVYTQGQSEESRYNLLATEGDILEGAPMIVLINSGSASASEIVAGALQDHGRALIVGEQSFGKGSVQTVIDLPDGKGLKYTSARYYTPNGRSIQGEGIKPDVTLAPLSVTLKPESYHLRESDMAGHLDNPNAQEELKDFTQENNQLAERDYPLYEALNLLKVLAITQ